MSGNTGLKIGDTIIPDSILVLEYSRSQLCFHVHSLTDALKSNLKSMLMGDPGDWVPVGLFANYEDLDRYQQKLIEQMKKPKLSKVSVEQLISEVGR